MPLMSRTYRAALPLGASVGETETLIREAIEFDLAGLKADGLPIPLPSSHVEYVDVPA